MGHYLDPLLEQVKAKYSADTHNAHSSGFDEGFEYAELLILKYLEIPLAVYPGRFVNVDDLLEYVRSQPSL